MKSEIRELRATTLFESTLKYVKGSITGVDDWRENARCMHIWLVCLLDVTQWEIRQTDGGEGVRVFRL